MIGLLIKPDNTFEVIEINRTTFLEECHTYLNADSIDFAYSNTNKFNIPFMAVVDDVGVCKGLKENLLASVVMCRTFPLCGDVLLFEYADTDGDGYSAVSLSALGQSCVSQLKELLAEKLEKGEI